MKNIFTDPTLIISLKIFGSLHKNHLFCDIKLISKTNHHESNRKDIQRTENLGVYCPFSPIGSIGVSAAI